MVAFRERRQEYGAWLVCSETVSVGAAHRVAQFRVYRQCEALGGRCGWTTNQPHGSVFWFAVPFISALACEPESDSPSWAKKGHMLNSSGPTPPSVPPLSGDSRTVLIIDDLQAQLVILKLQFKSIGFEKVRVHACAFESG